MSGPVAPHPQGAVLLVKVQPGARRSGLAGLHGELLKVSVAAAPERGQANAEVVDLLCRELALKKAQVTLLSGHAARQKRLLVTGVTVEELVSRIHQALAPH